MWEAPSLASAVVDGALSLLLWLVRGHVGSSMEATGAAPDTVRPGGPRDAAIARRLASWCMPPAPPRHLRARSDLHQLAPAASIPKSTPSCRWQRVHLVPQAGGGSGGGLGNGGGGGGGGGSGDDDEQPGQRKQGWAWKGWQERVAADPQFAFKVMIELIIGVSANVAGDMVRGQPAGGVVIAACLLPAFLPAHCSKRCPSPLSLSPCWRPS